MRGSRKIFQRGPSLRTVFFVVVIVVVVVVVVCFCFVFFYNEWIQIPLKSGH